MLFWEGGLQSVYLYIITMITSHIIESIYLKLISMLLSCPLINVFFIIKHTPEMTSHNVVQGNNCL